MLQERAVEVANINLLDKVRVVGRREGGLIEAYVPLELISREGVAVSYPHVIELADSIKEESERNSSNGQLSPLILGEVKGMINFPIIDGFHRTPALESLDRTEAYSTIRTNCTWEEVIDFRILATRTHKEVRFARLIEWMEEAWKLTEWADQIKVSQAFQLGNPMVGITGAKLGLDNNQVAQIRGWIDRKSKQWKLKPSSVHNYLSLTSGADPDLVRQVRDARDNTRDQGSLTSRQLMAIASLLPHDYQLQNLVAEVVVAEHLTESKTRILAAIIESAPSVEEAKMILSSGVWRFVETFNRRLQKEPARALSEAQRITDKLFDDELEIARLTIENAILTGRYNPLYRQNIEALPLAQREVLELRFVQGLTIAQTAQALGKEQNNIKVLQHKGTERLREITETDPGIPDNFKDETLPRIGLLSFDNEEGQVQDPVISQNDLNAFSKRLNEARPGLLQHLRSKALREDQVYEVISKLIVNGFADILEGRINPNLEGSSFLDYIVDSVRRILKEEEAPKETGKEHSQNLQDAVTSIEQKMKDPNIVKQLTPLLPGEERRILILASFFKLSPIEIALIKGLKLTIVTNKLSIAKSKMRDFIIRGGTLHSG